MKVRTCVLGLIAVATVGLFSCAAFADNVDAAVQQQIFAATFEVVQLKPSEGVVTYERALPMDLIPYQQRVDKYRSIGTAFAIGPNRYVTAGHVLALGEGSQFGPPALRDTAGTVYDIDRILKYSDDQDFVEFSLKHVPSPEKYLATADPPPVNDAVFAVGNALGQGVVLRDGVYTSDTPEEVNGRWKWLRFTAAASPGNSGGPLVDRQGRVVGIVLRKSESENLNYAAPIGLVAAAPDSQGIIDTRANFRLPMMDAAEVIEAHEHLPLPSSLPEFYAGLEKIMTAVVVRANAQVLDHNKARVFPNGPTSMRLLSQIFRSPYPRLIYEPQDRIWAVATAQTQTAQLENNGFVRYGGFAYLLRAPDDMRLATLYGDSKLYMDTLLRSGYSLSRTVGTDMVKVTSLGKAQQEYTSTDVWGRIWQIKIWAVPFADSYVLSMNLPTPQGYVAVIMNAPGAVRNIVLEQQKLLANFLYVTYEGTLSQWREYLPLKSFQPKLFSSLNILIDADYRQLRFASKRFELNVTPEVLPLVATTLLVLNTGFYQDGGTVVWDVGSILIGEAAQKNEYVDARRYNQPAPSLADNFQNNWKKLVAGEFPYNGVAVDDSGGMKVSAAVAPPGSASDQAKIRYALTIRAEGAPGQEAMHAKVEALRKAFKDLEH